MLKVSWLYAGRSGNRGVTAIAQRRQPTTTGHREDPRPVRQRGTARCFRTSSVNAQLLVRTFDKCASTVPTRRDPARLAERATGLPTSTWSMPTTPYDAGAARSDHRPTGSDGPAATTGLAGRRSGGDSHGADRLREGLARQRFPRSTASRRRRRRASGGSSGTTRWTKSERPAFADPAQQQANSERRRRTVRGRDDETVR